MNKNNYVLVLLEIVINCRNTTKKKKNDQVVRFIVVLTVHPNNLTINRYFFIDKTGLFINLFLTIDWYFFN